MIDGQFGTNFLRHFYDIHMLFKTERVRNFIGTEDYHKHKKARFRSQDNLNLKENDAFNLEKHPTVFKKYKEEYQKIKSLFISGTPEFEVIYDTIIALREIF